MVVYRNSNIYYGWLKTMSYYHLEGAGSGSYAKLIISEFAYNLEPNCGLIAGDTINSLLNGIGNRLYTEENIKIYPNPVIDFLERKIYKKLKRLSVKTLMMDYIS